MKKFLACVFILAVFSCAIFYIGWTQFRVKPEQIGIVVSKTNGVDETPVENGVFSWHWQFLLPTNAVLRTFVIRPVSVEKKVTGALPSGDAYASIYNAGNLFDYEFDFTISLTVSPQAIVELLKLNKINDDTNLEEYLSHAGETIAQLAADYILRRASENPSFRAESLRRDELLRGIQIYKDFPEIDVSTFAITKSKLPDYEMYRKLREMPLDVTSENQELQNE